MKKVIKELTNEHAMRFYFTFFSGETKTKHNPEQMFAYFRLYVKEYTTDHTVLADSNDNQKMFTQISDGDGNLSVDLQELNQLFSEKAMINGGKFESKHAFSMEGAAGSGAATGPSVKVTVEVIEDMPELTEDEQMAAEEFRQTAGILKKGEKREYILEDGQSKSFGKDNGAVNEHIDMKDLDDVQFLIRNYDG